MMVYRHKKTRWKNFLRGFPYRETRPSSGNREMLQPISGSGLQKPGRMMPLGGVCMQSRRSHILAHFGSLVLLLLLCLIFFFPFG